MPAEKLKLVHKGRAIHNDPKVSLSDQDVILAMKARPPAPVYSMHEHDACELEEPEETKVRLPANASALERTLLAKLRHDYHLSEAALTVIFAIRLQTWLIFLAWVAGAPLAHAFSFGPIYVIGSLILVIFLNLGIRQSGEASAYSIYNNFQELPGQLNANRLDDQVRRGQM